MKTLKITDFGPIKEAEVALGDMTILVGPQATGKSLFLQFLNLTLDNASIIKTLKDYGFTMNDVKGLLELYLGPGMGKNWKEDSKIVENGKTFELQKLVKSKPRRVEHNTFYIPAQRVLIMEEGWPRPFQSLPAYPFVVRDFSERLRMIMEAGLGKGKALFPQEGRLKGEIKDKIHTGIFRNSTIKLETEFKKRFVLETGGNDQIKLPLSLWSAGQREFMPLLLGLYYLTPGSRVSLKGKVKTVIIEELEMGLHPQAIEAVMFAMMELIHRGYRVVISTHSIHVVEMIWAIMEITKSKKDPINKPKAFGKLFGIENPRADIRKMAENCFRKTYKLYYFKPEEGTGFTRSREITSLDPSGEDPNISGWGGLSEFSSNIVDVVAWVHDVTSVNQD